jgi:predicted XRE-type DNA-binding protein
MAKANPENKAGHVTSGDVLEDLGFTAEEIRETEIKMTIWRPLRAEIEVRGLTQVELADLLQMHQPDASLLVRGRLEKFSVMRLMQFAEKLGLTVRLMVRPTGATRHGRARVSRSLLGQRGKVSPTKMGLRATGAGRQAR